MLSKGCQQIHNLESVQRPATKPIPEIRDLSYEEHSKRSKRLNMFSLRDHRIRVDFRETFEIIRNIDKINYANLSKILLTLITRKKYLKLKEQPFNTDLRRNVFNIL